MTAYLHFIINPISGSGKHNLTATTIRNHFPRSAFRIEVDYTRYKGHATALATEIALKNPDAIVACGGDGTINEIASCLVGTGIALGIVPIGSGNGLASHLGIPKLPEDAFALIRGDNNLSVIDVGKVNGLYFFSNMGIGIDAQIIKRYEQSGRRRLNAYVAAALSASFSYKPKSTVITTDSELKAIKPYLLFVSNSNEMGYSMSLTPDASLTDGYLDMVVVEELSYLAQLALGYRVLRNQIGNFKKARHSLVKGLLIEIPDFSFFELQLDGEFKKIAADRLSVSIVEKGLKVLTASP